MESKAAKKRSKNFTPAEVSVLVEEVEKRRGVLFGPLKGPNLTKFHRDRAWEQTLNAVNAVGSAVRTTAEIKKKFKDVKTRTKQKANAVKREGRKTGGGENEANKSLSALEEKVVQFIGNESIEGIIGGVDTFRKSIINRPSTSTSASAKDTSVASGTVDPAVPCCSSSPPPNSKKTKKSNSSNFKPGPAPAIPSIPKRGNKRKLLEEIHETNLLQKETNQLLRDLVSEFRNFKDEFLNIKKLELELMNQNLELKRKKLD